MVRHVRVLQVVLFGIFWSASSCGVRLIHTPRNLISYRRYLRFSSKVLLNSSRMRIFATPCFLINSLSQPIFDPEFLLINQMGRALKTTQSKVQSIYVSFNGMADRRLTLTYLRQKNNNNKVRGQDSPLPSLGHVSLWYKRDLRLFFGLLQPRPRKECAPVTPFIS